MLLLSCLLSFVPLTFQGWSGSDTWAFTPLEDDFKSDAKLDLRHLNEKTAGASGFVTTDADGNFRLGNGELARFWAVNTGVGREKPFVAKPLGRQTEPDLARHARFLAKRGVNMVRFHGQLSPDLGKHPDAKITDINTDERDWCWRLIAAMKKEGIYTTISPYWMVPMKFSASWKIPGGANQSAASLLFFDPNLKAAYKAWLKALLTEKNPYTGVSLSSDPALAIIEIQNEDSMLFWTINSLQGEEKQLLEKQFANWAVKKYGSAAKIQQAWSGQALKDDKSDGTGFDFYNIWEATQKQAGAKGIRVADQVQFLTETMRDFNREITEFIHKDLGCRQLVNAGNWRTADPVRLNDAERYSYTSTEVDAVNKYFDGVHKGPNSGWAITAGDQFTSPSALLDPKALPTNLKQTLGRPMIITESSWVLPMEYATEGPFLISAYQSLTGVAGYYWFATGDDEWTAPMSANGYMPNSLQKWSMATPDTMGTFPAAALMYRSGYIKRGKPVVIERRTLADIYSGRTPIIAEEASFDPNRDSGDIAIGSNIKASVNPLAFLVGPVTVDFNGDPSKSFVSDFSKYIDLSSQSVQSVTGEVQLNYGKGFCTVDTPSAQGVAAFFGSKPMVRLSDVTFLSQNEYGAGMAVSMDHLPIKESKQVLIQYGTRSRPTAWAQEPSSIPLDGGPSVKGTKIINVGKAPWQVQKAKLDVIIKNPSLHRVTALDMNGNAAGNIPIEKTNGGIRFKFPETAMYVVAE